MDSSVTSAGRVSKIKSVFDWKINAFLKSGKSSESKEFFASNARWQLQLSKQQNLLSLELKLLTVTNRSISAKIVSYILCDENNKMLQNNDVSKIFLKNENTVRLMDQKENTRLNDSKYLLDHKLTLVVEIETNSDACFEVPVKLEGLLNSDKFSDVIFFIEGKSLYAHKNILANKSSVFSAMFEHEMRENIENTVEIKDITYDVFLEMFRFIYSGTVANIDSVAEDLLVVADKYDLMDLKVICIGWLCNSLSVKNAINYLQFARRYNIEVLENDAIDFILSNTKSMIDLPGFDTIISLDSDILLKIIRGLVLKCNETVCEDLNHKLDHGTQYLLIKNRLLCNKTK